MKPHRHTPEASFRMPQVVTAMSHQAHLWWHQRTPRERRLLILAAWVAGLAAAWTLGIKPALDDVGRLQARLPVLRAQTAQVEALAMEAQGLRRRPARADDRPTTATINDSLRRAGLENVATVAVREPDGPAAATRWEVSFTHAESAGVMAWLAATPDQIRVQIAQASLRRGRVDEGGRPGQVSGTLVLQAPPETEARP